MDFSPTVADLGDGPYAFCHLAPLPWHLHVEFAEALRTRGASLISVDPDDRRLSEVPLSEVARLLRMVDMFMPSRPGRGGDVSRAGAARRAQGASRALA